MPDTLIKRHAPMEAVACWAGTHKTSGSCWRISFEVLGVLFLAEVSPAFLPSEKAYGIHKFQHFWVRQQYPSVIGAGAIRTLLRYLQLYYGIESYGFVGCSGHES